MTTIKVDMPILEKSIDDEFEKYFRTVPETDKKKNSRLVFFNAFKAGSKISNPDNDDMKKCLSWALGVIKAFDKADISPAVAESDDWKEMMEIRKLISDKFLD